MNPLTRYYIHQAGGGVGGNGEGSDLSIRSRPSFSEATVWAVYWADYFGRLDLSFSPAYAVMAKLWVGKH